MCEKCFCSIVPPIVLSELSKNGSETSKNTLADLLSLKLRRDAAIARIPVGVAQNGESKRFLYDSENSWELRRKLVRQEGDNPSTDKDVNRIYDVSGFMYKYFKEKFDYAPLDNKGMDLIFNVHYRDEYNNAYWDGDEMVFGDGDKKDFKGFASSIDVIAHELMHGVTQFTCNLQYYGQPGALNEHLSDVFGTIIKQRFLNQNVSDANWLIGEDVIGPDFPGIALRSMSAPGTANSFDIQPDHMDDYFNGQEDSQGVHINSGIPNKAFYLATMELGLDVTEVVWFETLRKLNPTSDFENMLDLILMTSEELANEGKIPRSAIEIIKHSFEKVGIKKKLVPILSTR